MSHSWQVIRIQYVKKFDYLPNRISDHTHYCLFTLSPPDHKRWGKGTWKTTDENLQYLLRSLLFSLKQKRTNYTTLDEWWDMAENKLKSEMISYGIKKAETDKRDIHHLQHLAQALKGETAMPHNFHVLSSKSWHAKKIAVLFALKRFAYFV